MQQYPNGIVPEEADKNLRGRCQQAAHQQVTAGFRARRQQQMMAAQGGMQQMNGMQNGMGM
jgi:transcription factor SPT20